ncbi:hypothetical protein RP20_CCG027114 [Aedes albopictus]|nr:hypothetical protein RP20_CCG027114 [Aedes albopictus]
MGHFINRCLKRTTTEFPVAGPPPPKRIRCVSEDEKDGFGQEKVFYAMGRNTFEFIVGGIRIPMIIDSGADANIIDEETWMRAKEMGMQIKEFSEQVDRKLIGYATKQPMTMKGMFRAEIQAAENVVNAKFYIVQQGKYNLLGDSTAKELKVLQVGFDVGLVNNQTTKPIPFPKIKGVLVEIPINKAVQPVQQGYCRAPIALEDKIYGKLKDLLEMDAIEKVNGPSPWVTPVVPIMKRSGELRLCVDMRRANQAVLRETHPLPVIEELLGSVEGAVKFSKLDVKEAYHQLEISQDSRIITTFITKYGLFRYKRLMFGVSCAPELFQKVMDTVVARLEGVIVYLDDCLVSGRTQEEHDFRLNARLNRFKEYGVLLNWDKCVFNVERLECLGHELSI